MSSYNWAKKLYDAKTSIKARRDVLPLWAFLCQNVVGGDTRAGRRDSFCRSARQKCECHIKAKAVGQPRRLARRDRVRRRSAPHRRGRVGRRPSASCHRRSWPSRASVVGVAPPTRTTPALVRPAMNVDADAQFRRLLHTLDHLVVDCVPPEQRPLLMRALQTTLDKLTATEPRASVPVDTAPTDARPPCPGVAAADADAGRATPKGTDY